jgi:hypothetical protein
MAGMSPGTARPTTRQGSDAKARERKTKSAKLAGKMASTGSHQDVFNAHRIVPRDEPEKLEHLEGALENMEKDL